MIIYSHKLYHIQNLSSEVVLVMQQELNPTKCQLILYNLLDKGMEGTLHQKLLGTIYEEPIVCGLAIWPRLIWTCTTDEKATPITP